MKFNVGDTAHIKVPGSGWVKVKVISINGNIYNVKILNRPVSRPAAFGVPSHRLHTENEYLAIMEKRRALHPYRNPSRTQLL